MQQKHTAPKRATVTRSTKATSVSSAAHALPDFGSASLVPRKTRSSGQFFRALVIILILAGLAGYAGYTANKPGGLFNRAAAVQKFSAVFLNTGQVYFGVIKSEDANNLVLSSVFYIQTVDEQIPAEKEGEEPTVVQRPQLMMKGDEPYAPSNTIRINRDQVTVIEELQESSQILQQIQARLSKQ